MTLTKRGTKGEALTHDELDANFTHLGGDGSYTFPATDYSTAGAVLTTDGNGQVSWSSTPTQVLQTIYPVGSVYINATNPTNAGTLLGFGTWEAFGSGRVPVGINASDTDFDTAEETGGSKTHTLTVAEMPSHQHMTGSNDSGTGTGGAPGNMELTRDYGTGNGPDVDTSNTGGGGAHNNLQPYIVVYMWKRTA